MSTEEWTGWRVLPVEEDRPQRLLARGLTLLDGLEDAPVPTLRWYRATSTAIVLGRGQRRLAVQPAEGLEVVVRATGGGAVLLDPHVRSLDVLLPAGHPWVFDDVGEVFRHVGRAWARALDALGVPDVRAHEGPSQRPSTRAAGGEGQALAAAVCYAAVGRGEVTAGGRKLVGLAQRRRRHGTLVQCGLLRAWDPGRLLAALGADPADDGVRTAAVGLDELLEDPPDDATLMAAVEAAMADAPSAERDAPPATPDAPSAERDAPSATPDAPSAERDAPSAERDAPSATPDADPAAPTAAPTTTAPPPRRGR